MRIPALPPVVLDSTAALPVRSWTSTPTGRPLLPQMAPIAPPRDGVTAITTSDRSTAVANPLWAKKEASMSDLPPRPGLAGTACRRRDTQTPSSCSSQRSPR